MLDLQWKVIFYLHQFNHFQAKSLTFLMLSPVISRYSSKFVDKLIITQFSLFFTVCECFLLDFKLISSRSDALMIYFPSFLPGSCLHSCTKTDFPQIRNYSTQFCSKLSIDHDYTWGIFIMLSVFWS